jgi:hypothetical protein
MPRKAVTTFLFGMYVAAAGVLTFDSPYTTTGNGYFFSWGGFVFSVHAFYLSYDFMINMVQGTKEDIEVQVLEKRMAVGCAICSAIELIESCVMCDKGDSYCTDKIKFGIAMGAIGVLVSATIYLLYTKLMKVLPYISLLTSILWGVASVVLTFKGGPYNITGNGYFSAWGAFIFSFGLTFLTSRQLVSQKWDEMTNQSTSDEVPVSSAQPAQPKHSSGPD